MAKTIHIKVYLHFDPAVYCLEDFSVVDGMDLDEECETLGYYEDRQDVRGNELKTVNQRD